ncbi:MAG: hypothetical protein DRO12_03085 [Thermoprotei archaeon]|nr:MAG: hypothetical protein DRO12_03085 [Thermoprotei archaeon]
MQREFSTLFNNTDKRKGKGDSERRRKANDLALVLTAEIDNTTIYCFEGRAKKGLRKIVCWAQDRMDDDNMV